MNCEQVREKLEAYFDGELGAEERAAFEEALSGCPECEEELSALASIRSEMRASTEQDLAEVRFEGLWEGVAADIRQSEGIQVVPESEPGPIERLFGSFSWGKLVPIGAAALAMTFALAGDWGSSEGETPFPMPEDNVAFVSAVQYERGMVFIDQDPNDATAALIVWHTTDES
jgi:anti-sigma factor RsiW